MIGHRHLAPGAGGDGSNDNLIFWLGKVICSVGIGSCVIVVTMLSRTVIATHCCGHPRKFGDRDWTRVKVLEKPVVVMVDVEADPPFCKSVDWLR